MNEEITLNVTESSPYVIGAVAYVEQLDDGAKITIIDKNGTTTAVVNDGNGIQSVTLNEDYTLTIYYTDGTSITTTSIRGETGASGVYVGEEEPDNPDVNVWVDPSGDADEDFIQQYIDSWLDTHPEAVTTVDYSITTKVFDTVAQMVEDSTLAVGEKTATMGYYSANDGGSAYYIIVSSSTRAGSITLSNGLVAEMIGRRANNRQLGIKANTNGQARLNTFIADTSFERLDIIDPIIVQKTASTTSDVDIIELVQVRRDNFTIVFSEEGKFILETLGEDFYRMLAIANADNITIVNPTLIGDADTIGIAVGEYGHGIYLRGASNVVVYNGNIGKCFGDAVCVGAGSENITFLGTLYCYDCGRQGMSVGDANGLYVDTIVGKNIRRTAPGSVIDFEPNTNTESIIAKVGTIRAIDCRIGLDVAGRGDKVISVDSLITEHNDNNYSCDLEVYGALGYGENPIVNISINRINVKDSRKNCIRLLHAHSNLALKIEAVTIDGVNKTTASSIDEATMFIDQDNNTVLRNINIGRINAINNVSTVTQYGVFLYSSSSKKCTIKNCHIEYYDDSTQIVESHLRYATLEDVTLKTQIQSNGRYELNSDIETIEMPTETKLRIGGFPKHLFIKNYTSAKFTLYSLFLDGYTANSESYISPVSSGWEVFGTGLFFINFNHTAKTIAITKLT